MNPQNPQYPHTPPPGGWSPYDEQGRPRPSGPAHPGAPQGGPAGHRGYPGDPYRQIPSEDRGWAVGAHIATLVALYLSAGWLGFAVPLVIWLITKDSKPFARQAAAGAFNFNVTLFIVNAIAWILFVTVVGIVVAVPLWIAAAVLALVCHVLGTVRAAQGRTYRYPLQIPVLS